MFSIRQVGEQWELLHDGNVIATCATYGLAVDELVDRLAAQPETQGDEAGLLPERWRSDCAFSEPTGDGRDFTNCTWTSRDPAVSTMPVMLQTTTEFAHFGAELAGFFETCDTGGDHPTGTGRFYDSERGRQLRDMLLGGRRFGVSVDPGDVDAEMICDVMDDDGYCEEAHIDFHAYEIIGMTATPFPGFAAAMIELDGASSSAPPPPAAPAEGQAARTAAASDESAVATLATARTRVSLAHPPHSWFDDPALLMPTPLTITNEGHVLGHVAAWGTCHVGSDRVCITPPTSALAYRRFRSGGEVLCSDDSRVRTGALTWGIPHADLNALMVQAQEHYANSRHGWADVNIGEDDHGIWIAGAIRPHLDEHDLRVLRALALSGDWRYDREASGLELIAALAVNVPGFPIPSVVTASGVSVEQPRVRAGVGAGERQMALVASGIVLPEHVSALTRRPCGCDENDSTGETLERIERAVAVLDRRTAHLTSDAIENLARRLGLSSEGVPLAAFRDGQSVPTAAFTPRRQG